MMQVEILLFARAREAADADRIQIDVSDDATASELLDAIADQIPGIRDLIPACRLAVDDAYVSGNTVITAGSEFALIPPVSGG